MIEVGKFFVWLYRPAACLESSTLHRVSCKPPTSMFAVKTQFAQLVSMCSICIPLSKDADTPQLLMAYRSAQHFIISPVDVGQHRSSYLG